MNTWRVLHSNEHGEPGYLRVLSKDRRPFQTRDGWMAVLPYTHEQWRRFLLEIARADLVAQPWFDSATERSAHIDELYAAVSEGLRARSTADWRETLLRLDIPFAPVTSLKDLLVDPHLADIGFFRTGPRLSTGDQAFGRAADLLWHPGQASGPTAAQPRRRHAQHPAGVWLQR